MLYLPHFRVYKPAVLQPWQIKADRILTAFALTYSIPAYICKSYGDNATPHLSRQQQGAWKNIPMIAIMARRPLASSALSFFFLSLRHHGTSLFLNQNPDSTSAGQCGLDCDLGDRARLTDHIALRPHPLLQAELPVYF